jgi:Icc-related predicted phosphoesterase
VLYLKDIFIPALRDFKKRSDVDIYLDFGNDDLAVNRYILEEQDGGLIRLLHNSKQWLTQNVDILGYMNVPPTPFTLKDWEKADTPQRPHALEQQISIKGYVSRSGSMKEITLDLESDDTIESDLKRLSDKIDKPFIFISHAPPYDTPLDVIYNGLNVGSVGIRRFIEKWSKKGLLLASFHGHIHESPDRTGSVSIKIGHALCFNPGQGNGIGSKFRYITFELKNREIHYNSFVQFQSQKSSL